MFLCVYLLLLTRETPQFLSTVGEGRKRGLFRWYIRRVENSRVHFWSRDSQGIMFSCMYMFTAYCSWNFGFFDLLWLVKYEFPWIFYVSHENPSLFPLAFRSCETLVCSRLGKAHPNWTFLEHVAFIEYCFRGVLTAYRSWTGFDLGETEQCFLVHLPHFGWRWWKGRNFTLLARTDEVYLFLLLVFPVKRESGGFLHVYGRKPPNFSLAP